MMCTVAFLVNVLLGEAWSWLFHLIHLTGTLQKVFDHCTCFSNSRFKGTSKRDATGEVHHL
jgi:hypothetical protein